MENLENLPRIVHFDRHELADLYDEGYQENDDSEEAKDHMLKVIGNFAIEHYKLSTQPVYVRWSAYDQSMIGKIVSYHSDVVVFLMDISNPDIRAYWHWHQTGQLHNFIPYPLDSENYAIGYESMGDYSDYIEEVFTLGAVCNSFHKRTLERYDT